MSKTALDGNRFMPLEKHKQDWEDLGSLDPLWAILTYPRTRFGRWDITKFIASGEAEVDALMQAIASLGVPREKELLLDFGCGVGRLTRAFAGRFQHCYGVDISEAMIAGAKRLNERITNCTFLRNSELHLRMFPDNHFDMICSVLVLMHLPDSQSIKSYLAEFVRVLKPEGLIVFQLPCYLALKRRLQPRPKLYRLLRRFGVSAQFLYQTLRLSPMRTTYIPEKDVVEFLKDRGAKILRIDSEQDAGPQPSRTYFCSK